MGGAGKKRSERAVSPVIGVMLMLVITVLLAAAVSSFTGGLKAQKPAPTANFEVKIVKNATTDMGYKCTYMQITEVSGDRIPTKDLEIITYNPDAYGSHKIMVVKPNSMNTHFYFSGTWKGYIAVTNSSSVKPVSVPIKYTYSGWKNGTSPYLNNVAYGYFGESSPSGKYLVNVSGTWITATYNYTLGALVIPSSYNLSQVAGAEYIGTWKPDNPKVDFGSYTIHPGVTLTADWYSNFPQAKWDKNTGWYDGANVTGFCACIADGWNVTPGHYITVKIVYTPTHTVIWEKKVLVEGEGI